MAKEHYIKTMNKVRPIDDLFRDHGILYTGDESSAVIRLDCSVSKITGKVTITQAIRNRG